MAANSIKLDQFYTKPNVAKECFDELKNHVKLSTFDIILEPSAGTGAFYNLFPRAKRVGIDLDPKCPGVVMMDFFNFTNDPTKRYIVVGNPPFGKVGSLSIKFFNMAAKFSQVIAFIVPRTFKRVSFQNQLDLNFELVHNRDLSVKPCCFEPAMSAKCCFQIWKRTSVPRQKIIFSTTHPDWTFLKMGPLDKKGQPTPNWR